PAGPTTVIWTVTDAAGNTATCSFIVTVEDNTPPTVTAAADINTTTSADDLGDCDVSVAVPDATFGDNCTGSTLAWVMTGVTIDNGSGQVGTHIFNIGVTTITYTVTDAAGNTATDVLTVTVTDDENPTVTSAADINTTTSADDLGDCDVSVAVPDATFGDNCTGSTLAWVMTGVTIDNGSGQVGTHIFNIGVTTITYTATDAAGNTATDVLTVTV